MAEHLENALGESRGEELKRELCRWSPIRSDDWDPYAGVPSPVRLPWGLDESVHAIVASLESAGNERPDVDLRDVREVQALEVLAGQPWSPRGEFLLDPDRQLAVDLPDEPGNARTIVDLSERLAARAMEREAVRSAVDQLRPAPRRRALTREVRREVLRQLYALRRSLCPPDVLSEYSYMANHAKGLADDGTLVDLEQPVWVDLSCEWRGAPLPVLRIGSAPEALLLYVHYGYLFHPDATPEEVDVDSAKALDRTDEGGVIHVVDTGHCRPGTHLDHERDPFINSAHKDMAYGHGPAIVSLLEELLEEAPGIEIQLHQVRYDQGVATVKHPGQVGSVPVVMPVPNGSGTDLIRSFDENALIATLKGLGALRAGSIVNLSLGAVDCPGKRGDDPVRAFIEQNQQATFVVAAGNHTNDAPSWPAAYGDEDPTRRMPELAGATYLANVVSVGSGDGVDADGRATAHHFSAKPDPDPSPNSSWIRRWENGYEVPVDHPLHDPAAKPLEQENATWSGTSFAAPKIAAREALGT
ncbi:MAG: S8 family serine peptidase [Actinomycetota bacterium]